MDGSASQSLPCLEPLCVRIASLNLAVASLLSGHGAVLQQFAQDVQPCSCLLVVRPSCRLAEFPRTVQLRSYLFFAVSHCAGFRKIALKNLISRLSPSCRAVALALGKSWWTVHLCSFLPAVEPWAASQVCAVDNLAGTLLLLGRRAGFCRVSRLFNFLAASLLPGRRAGSQQFALEVSALQLLHYRRAGVQAPRNP